MPLRSGPIDGDKWFWAFKETGPLSLIVGLGSVSSLLRSVTLSSASFVPPTSYVVASFVQCTMLASSLILSTSICSCLEWTLGLALYDAFNFLKLSKSRFPGIFLLSASAGVAPSTALSTSCSSKVRCPSAWFSSCLGGRDASVASVV